MQESCRNVKEPQIWTGNCLWESELTGSHGMMLNISKYSYNYYIKSPSVYMGERAYKGLDTYNYLVSG